MQQIEIFPSPKKVVIGQGYATMPTGFILQADSAITCDFERRGTVWGQILPLAQHKQDGTMPLYVGMNTALDSEAYRLTITQRSVKIDCGDAAGAYYAALTLGQILRQTANDNLPCLTVQDSPALALRGILLDIGRNKIPEMHTLRMLIDHFSAMKINHLQLYMDGYCFKWEKYAYLFSDETPLTAQEVQELVSYAQARFIDLVPNCNSLGHMEHWLAKPQFRQFAECENGFDFQGLYHREPGTLDPQNKQAVAWVQSLFDELLANFNASLVNVNLDEPFELGKGKNKQLAQTQGSHAPYLLMVNSMYNYCKAHGKHMMMWGDVLLDSPACIPDLPRDITVLDWMYEGDGSFEPHAQLLHSHNISFVLCPGTSTWCSFTGRSNRMQQNIQDAVDCAIRYSGKGILLTDWGDLGHWQYISASYVPFAFGAGLSWAGLRQKAEEVFAYCNREILGDASGKAANILYELGNYYQYENAPLLSTTLCAGVMTAKHKFSTREDFPAAVELLLALSHNLAKGMGIPLAHTNIRLNEAGLRNFVTTLLAQTSKLHLQCPDGPLIKREIQNAGRFVLHGLTLYSTMANTTDNSASFEAAMNYLFNDMDALLKEHYDLWRSRNRTGGYATSTAQLLHLMQVYNRYRTN